MKKKKKMRERERGKEFPFSPTKVPSTTRLKPSSLPPLLIFPPTETFSRFLLACNIIFSRFDRVPRQEENVCDVAHPVVAPRARYYLDIRKGWLQATGQVLIGANFLER